MSSSRRRLAFLVVVALVAVLAGPAGGTASTASTQLTVYAAASLTDVFPAIAPHEKYSFGGSNALATQIQQGAPADVFASANLTLPTQLFQQKLCSKPVVFTRNRLVVVVPRSNPAHIRNVYNLTKSGVTIDIAAKGVPVGTYTLQILKNMNLTNAVLKNVVSQETDVREVLAKVDLGEVDAGFVYSTDAKTVAGKVRVIKIPAWAQPKVQYGICVVASSSNKPAAKAFIKKVLSKAGQKKLHKFGFLARVKK
ncbi:MAG TPA: molybdate ABC transporter substrate-binding protein [Gaiellaceae bacterium]